MADTIRLRSALLTLLADNTTHEISPQDVRDFLISVMTNLPIVAKSSGSPYTASIDDGVIIVTQDADYTITLPAAATAGWTGKILYIKKANSEARTLTIDPNASETIDGNTTLALVAQNSSIKIICDGSNWYVLQYA